MLLRLTGSHRILCRVSVFPSGISVATTTLDLICDFRDVNHKNLKISVTCLLELLKSCSSLEDCRLTAYGKPIEGPLQEVSLPNLKKLRLTSEGPLARALLSHLDKIPKDAKVLFYTEDTGTACAFNILEDLLPHGSYFRAVYFPTEGVGLQLSASKDDVSLTLGNLTVRFKHGANSNYRVGQWYERIQQILPHAVAGLQFTALDISLQAEFSVDCWKGLFRQATEVKTMIYRCRDGREFLTALAGSGGAGRGLKKMTELEFCGVGFEEATLARLCEMIKWKKGSRNPIGKITIYESRSEGIRIKGGDTFFQIVRGLEPHGNLYYQIKD